MNIHLNLKIHKSLHVGPNINVWLNGNIKNTFANIQEDRLELDLKLDDHLLKKNNVLLIDHYGKDPNSIDASLGDVAVEIEEIWFDRLKLHRNLMFEQLFFPNWEFGHVENVIQNNCYVGFNGVWQLIFPDDPFSWITDYLESEMFSSDTENSDHSSSTDTENFENFRKDFF